MGDTVASANARLYLSWEVSFFCGKLLWDVKESSSCLFTTHFWLRMTSLDGLNYKEKGEAPCTFWASWKETPVNAALPIATDCGQN